MCGILGIYNFDISSKFNQNIFRRALLTMSHRGPDGCGVNSYQNKIILGHLRLAIIDLNKNNDQPFELDNRYSIVYNGEIYNYVELRDELKRHGHKFVTNGDTEVLLRSYILWGEECVHRFNGMWAFGIYDRQKDVLFCSRDRFGVKPFYYSIVNSQFIFSSELKAIISYFPQLRKANYNLISNFCRFGVGAQSSQTWFENIFRLEPGNSISISGKNHKVYRYWEYPKEVKKNISFEDSILEYRTLFLDAVKIRMRSDVPVGIALSSGLDSMSILFALLHCSSNNIKTFTACFKPEVFSKLEISTFSNDINFSEANVVKKVLIDNNINGNLVEVNYDDYITDLKRLIYILESGHASPAIYPMYKLMRVARNDVKVMIEGQGADELLAGYISLHGVYYMLELLCKFRLRKFFKELSLYRKNYSLKMGLFQFFRNIDFELFNRVYFKLSGSEKIFTGPLKNYSFIKSNENKFRTSHSILNKVLINSHSAGLVNLLHYGDSISMSNSIESRNPFLDFRLVEFLFKLPSDYKIKYGTGKYIHRCAMTKIVNDDILSSKLKFGFDSPLLPIFLNEGKGSAKSILLSDMFKNRGLFSQIEVMKILQEINEKNFSRIRLLFRILTVEIWFRTFMDFESDISVKQ